MKNHNSISHKHLDQNKKVPLESSQLKTNNALIRSLRTKIA